MSAAKRHSLFELLIGILFSGCLETAGSEAAPGYQWLNRSTRSAGGVSGGVALNFSRGIAVDGTGHPFITGSFSRRMDIGGTNLVSSGDDDLFLARFDGNGDLLWARQGGGSGKDQATAIAVDASGNALIAGEFTGSFASRVATFGDLSLTLSAERAGDDFVVKYDPSGNALWAHQIAGGSDQLPTALAIDSQGNSYVLGSLDGAAVAIFGVATLFSRYPNYYLAKIRNDGSAIWAFQGEQAPEFFAEGLTGTVNASGNAYVGGRVFADFFWGKLAADADRSPPTILRRGRFDARWNWSKPASSRPPILWTANGR